MICKMPCWIFMGDCGDMLNLLDYPHEHRVGTHTLWECVHTENHHAQTLSIWSDFVSPFLLCTISLSYTYSTLLTYSTFIFTDSQYLFLAYEVTYMHVMLRFATSLWVCVWKNSALSTNSCCKARRVHMRPSWMGIGSSRALEEHLAEEASQRHDSD